MKETKKNLAASIHARLLNQARSEDRPLNELLQYYAIERFLYRLGQSGYRQKFVLKGAQMLRAWSAPLARPTMDIDLLGKVNNDIENLEKIVRECCSMDFDDGVSFEPKSVRGGLIRKDAEYQGVRVNLKGVLGKIRLHLQIDFGFGDAVFPAPIEVELPQLLDFGKPHLLGYTPESAIAEKFHAMVTLDATNTRMKDFYDIWLLSKNLKFDEKVLAAAIKETFERRNTSLPNAVPTAFTSTFCQDENKQRQWKAFLRKNRLDTEIDLEEAIREIESFLMPIVLSID